MSGKRTKSWIVVPVILGLAVGPAFGHTKYRYNPAGQPRHKLVHHVHKQGDAAAKGSHQSKAPDLLRGVGHVAEGSLKLVGDAVSSVLSLGKSSPQAGS